MTKASRASTLVTPVVISHVSTLINGAFAEYEPSDRTSEVSCGTESRVPLDAAFVNIGGTSISEDNTRLT